MIKILVDVEKRSLIDYAGYKRYEYSIEDLNGELLSITITHDDRSMHFEHVEQHTLQKFRGALLTQLDTRGKYRQNLERMNSLDIADDYYKIKEIENIFERLRKLEDSIEFSIREVT